VIERLVDSDRERAALAPQRLFGQLVQLRGVCSG